MFGLTASFFSKLFYINNIPGKCRQLMFYQIDVDFDLSCDLANKLIYQ